MNAVSADDLERLYIPPPDSHKGQNGKLLIIGGSHLFHAASLWALTVASRIVDLVHYSSVPENNELVQKAKDEFRNGIVVLRDDVDSYIEEDDCILIGPGMERNAETEELTNRLLKSHPNKQWVIDAGSLQMLDLSVIPNNAILTPHAQEYRGLTNEQDPQAFAKQHNWIVLLKGDKDIAASPTQMREIEGGNAVMTKGGTGDVLAGLIAALACKNDPFLATIAGSFINKRAGDELFAKVGPYFNATDLATQIPVTMKNLFYAGTS